jgi:hypothetical protein
MLSVALTDSPVGFASCMWDLIHGSGDDDKYTFEEIVDHIMLLWIQEPAESTWGYSILSQVLVCWAAHPKGKD